MARVKKPPRANDEAHIMPSPSNPSDTIDATPAHESAKTHVPEPHSSHMLPSSSHASPPLPAAVFGANLLNAARTDHHNNSHTGGITGRKNRPGKLPQVTTKPKSSDTNVATRGDFYEIQVSPVKHSHMLRERVSQKPRNIRKKKKDSDGKPIAGLPAETATAESGNPETQQVAQEVIPRKKRKSASVHDEDQHATLTGGRKERARGRISTTASQEFDTTNRTASANEEWNNPTEAGGDDGDTLRDGQTAPATKRAANIETVFKFLDIEERPGQCLTKYSRSLIRICQKSCENLQDETISTETVVEDASEIQNELKACSGTLSEEYQLKLKSDVYGHVFRSLVVYLRALHNWLLKTHESVKESLEALRIITPLINAILVLKDTIAQWNVTVAQRYKGNRPIKHVDSYLIAPLRQVGKSFSARLSQLEEAEHRLNYDREMRRMMEEQHEEENARSMATEAMQERKKRWQNLHIVRMQCEPDIYRRRRLFHIGFEDLVERDANGVVFERLPLFKSRSGPPHSRISEIADETKWTEKEEIAVLEGLQHCAGPYVFEKMFKTYCDPRSPHPCAGDLRDRSVAEIVSKARWIHSTMLVFCQETGEPVEEWVTKIPMLP